MNKILFVVLVGLILISFSCLNPIGFSPELSMSLDIKGELNINPATEAVVVVKNKTNAEITVVFPDNNLSVIVLPHSSKTPYLGDSPMRFKAGNVSFKVDNGLLHTAALFGISYITVGIDGLPDHVTGDVNVNQSVLNNNIITIDVPFDGTGLIDEIKVSNQIWAEMSVMLSKLSIKTASIYIRNSTEYDLMCVAVSEKGKVASIFMPKSDLTTGKSNFRYLAIPNYDSTDKNWNVTATIINPVAYAGTSADIQVGIRESSSASLPSEWMNLNIEYADFNIGNFDITVPPPPPPGPSSPIVSGISLFMMRAWPFKLWTADADTANSPKTVTWNSLNIGDELNPTGTFNGPGTIAERQAIADQVIRRYGSGVQPVTGGVTVFAVKIVSWTDCWWEWEIPASANNGNAIIMRLNFTN